MHFVIFYHYSYPMDNIHYNEPSIKYTLSCIQDTYKETKIMDFSVLLANLDGSGHSLAQSRTRSSLKRFLGHLALHSGVS